MILADVDWAGLTGLLVAVISALAAALPPLMVAYFRAKRGQDVLSKAIEEGERTGEGAKAVLKRTVAGDTKLAAQLEDVRNRNTTRLEKGDL